MTFQENEEQPDTRVEKYDATKWTNQNCRGSRFPRHVVTFLEKVHVRLWHRVSAYAAPYSAGLIQIQGQRS